MDQIEIFCPGSVANISCGFDVLGFCLDPIGDIMRVTKTVTPGITIGTITGQDLPKDPQKRDFVVAAIALLNAILVNTALELI